MTKIALLIENSREYGRGLIRGIAAFGQERRDWLLRLLRPGDLKDPATLADYDGIIARVADRGTVARLQACRRPVVDVFGHFAGTGFVRVETNHAAVGRRAAEYFLAKGYRSIAFCGFAGTAYSDTRRDAFITRLAAERIRCEIYGRTELPDDSVLFDETPDRLRDPDALVSWLQDLDFPVAIFCANDLRALQLLHLAQKLGVDVPREAAILGVDNDALLCSFSTPPLSSIDPNPFGVGYAAARLLQAVLDHPPEKKEHTPFLVQPGELIERASTEHHPVSPAWFAAALVQVDRCLPRTLSASDIVAVTGKSSTAVEKRFHAEFGCSVGRYILSRKMELAQRLLASGRLSVKEVAARTGFTSPQYFCRSFRAYYGRTPLDRN